MTAAPAVPADHVFVIVDRQFPECPPPGVHLWPIGMAMESIKCGNSRIDPRSKSQFETFVKAQEAAALRHSERLAKRNKELAKSAKK